MKRKQLLSLLLCGALLSGMAQGCAQLSGIAQGHAKTPEHPLVREKKGPSLENYEKADPLEPAADGSTLARHLQVPDTYEASAASDDNSFQLSCHAQVTVPDVTQIPLWKVSQKPFDEAWISQVTETFFGDAPIYDGDSYFRFSKEQIQERINELKAYEAEGNLDPYGYIAYAQEEGWENPEQYFNLQESISIYEKEYDNTPETIEKTKVTPVLSEDDTGDSSSRYFEGAVELDGSAYRYSMKAGPANSMDIKISRAGTDNSPLEWNYFLYDYQLEGGYYSMENDFPSREKAEEMAGITEKQAVEIADRYMEKLGLTDFSAKTTALSLGRLHPSGPPVSYPYSEAGYRISYTRDIQGFPVTDELIPGLSMPSMDSTTEPWGYEKVYFCVNKDGLQQAEILNLYQVEEQQIDNVTLLSFPEIADIFENMARIKCSDYVSPGESIRLDVTKAVLGYTRIYDPDTDNTSGILVPVWDFFGTKERLVNEESGNSRTKEGIPDQSFLTINAANGTMVDRSLGY